MEKGWTDTRFEVYPLPDTLCASPMLRRVKNGASVPTPAVKKAMTSRPAVSSIVQCERRDSDLMNVTRARNILPHTRREPMSVDNTEDFAANALL
jgi:hypothetical protein